MPDANLGDVITALYDGFLTRLGDAELASVATAAAVNELLAEYAVPRVEENFS